MTLSPVHACVLDGAGSARGARDEEIAEGVSADGALWLHLDHTSDGTRAWLETLDGLDEVTVDALLSEAPRARSVQVGQGLLVILRAVNFNEGQDAEDLVSLRLWVTDRRVLTIRGRRIAAVGEVLAQFERNRGPVDTADLLHELVERLLDRLGDLVLAIEDAVDDLEEAVLTAEGRDLRTRLSDVRRQSIALRRHVLPQRDMLNRLHTERVAWLKELDRARLRESGDRVTRYVETLDAARDRATVTHEELTNRLAEQMNRTMYTLSVVAAIFLPLGLLTGLLGINVGGIPGTESPWSFTLVTLLLVALGVLEWLWFKRNNMF